MSSYWQRARTYLGLGSDEDYADFGYGEYDDEAAFVSTRGGDGAAERGSRSRPAGQSRPAAAPRRPMVDDADETDDPAWEIGAVRVISSSTPRAASAEEATRRNVVRPMPSLVTARPKVLSPASFNDAQAIGDLFRSRQPVIVNLQGLDRDLARRLLDFASGVSYALSGSVERVSTHVYLLTPEDVEVSADDRQKIRDHGIGSD